MKCHRKLHVDTDITLHYITFGLYVSVLLRRVGVMTDDDDDDELAHHYSAAAAAAGRYSTMQSRRALCSVTLSWLARGSSVDCTRRCVLSSVELLMLQVNSSAGAARSRDTC